MESLKLSGSRFQQSIAQHYCHRWKITRGVKMGLNACSAVMGEKIIHFSSVFASTAAKLVLNLTVERSGWVAAPRTLATKTISMKTLKY